MTDSLLSDGLHPNDSGYAVMFEIIAKALGFGIVTAKQSLPYEKRKKHGKIALKNSRRG